jgi:hypothetical protein
VTKNKLKNINTYKIKFVCPKKTIKMVMSEKLAPAAEIKINETFANLAKMVRY